MGVVNYYSVGGQFQGEQPLGGARVDYLTDALGSVTATVQQTGAGTATLQNTYQYKPYGQMLAKTGGAPDPAFLWVGSRGYRQTGRDYSGVYVRARHYGSQQGRWTTKDPIGYDGGGNVYGYVGGSTTSYIDATGLEKKPCDGAPIYNTVDSSGLSTAQKPRASQGYKPPKKNSPKWNCYSQRYNACIKGGENPYACCIDSTNACGLDSCLCDYPPMSPPKHPPLPPWPEPTNPGTPGTKPTIPYPHPPSLDCVPGLGQKNFGGPPPKNPSRPPGTSPWLGPPGYALPDPPGILIGLLDPTACSDAVCIDETSMWRDACECCQRLPDEDYDNNCVNICDIYEKWKEYCGKRGATN